MAGMCCGVVGETEAAVAAAATAVVESSSKASRRRRLELRPFKFMPAAAAAAAAADVSVPVAPSKRQKLDLCPARECDNAVENCGRLEEETKHPSSNTSQGEMKRNGDVFLNMCSDLKAKEEKEKEEVKVVEERPKFGMTSVCGRRRDMEDAVSIHSSFCKQGSRVLHFYGVFDGHGCSHVATKCREQLHEIVKEEIDKFGGNELSSIEWKAAMERSFDRMDKEVHEWTVGPRTSNCRCELQTPQCDAVGTTAVVVIVTPDKIIVSNCGDSRAVLCSNGVALPLSSDHKPDRPDELLRIQEAGGRVIYWDGPRVLGVLAMSRAIGDNYLKPFVISVPEVTVMDRTAEDECLILASDGLWDVVSNDTACGVSRMCLKAQKPPSPPASPGSEAATAAAATASAMSSDKACSDASILLTKLALARHSTDNVSVVVVDLKKGNQNQ